MARRDIFTPVDRPPELPPSKPEAPTSFQDRWTELGNLVEHTFGHEKRYWLETKLAAMPKLAAASKQASNDAWAIALDELRGVKICPHDIAAWLAAALDRAILAEQHKPAEHRADDGAVLERRHRAYGRIARQAGQGAT